MNPYQWRIDQLKNELRILETQEIRKPSASALVTMHPVCDCGYVFDKLVASYTEIKTDGDYTIPIGYAFNPSFCPSCKRAISAVVADNMSIFNGDKNFTI